MADQELIDLVAETDPAGSALVYVVTDPSGSPLDRKVTLTNLAGSAAFDAVINAAVAALVNGAPASGDTLGELHTRLAEPQRSLSH